MSVRKGNSRATSWMGFAILLALSALRGQTPLALYVLDFDNLQGDERIDWLSRAMKDIVLLRLENVPNVIGRDAVKILPSLDARLGRIPAPADRWGRPLLLMGSYRREGARLNIDLQLLDMNEWSGLGQERVEAIYGNMPALNDILWQGVQDLLGQLAVTAEQPAAQPSDEKPAPSRPAIAEEDLQIMPSAETYSKLLPQLQENLNQAVDALEETLDTYAGFRQEPQGTFQEGDAYYREFSLEGHGALPEEKARYSALFEKVLRQVARNPYSAEIGELGILVDPIRGNRVSLSIPVHYRVKQALVTDLLNSLPYESTQQKGYLRTVRYAKSKFDFSSNLVDGIARGDYRVIPVVKLMDQAGRAWAVIVDSPDISWERYFPNGAVPVSRQKGFVSLLAITTTGFSVDVILETGEFEVVYDFEVNAAQLSRTTRVVVEFMNENQLHRFLAAL